MKVVNPYISFSVEPPTIEWVTIEQAGNLGDTAHDGYGGVTVNYRISKFVIRESYIDDYNADPANAGALQITLDERGDDKPATKISWNEAARYVNWLNDIEGEQEAYKFDTGGANDNISVWDSADAWQIGGENLYRHKDTKYFLPSEDEWYKAAYYNGQANVYYNYPTGSDTAPVGTLGGTAPGTAVYDDGIVSPTGPADVTNAGGLSPYETMGQGGNTYEWNESALDGDNSLATESRARRGGSWDSTSTNLQSSYRNDNIPSGENDNRGFRVAAKV